MQSASPASVTCVVLNWNGWRDTIPCVESLLAQDYPALTLVIVDNASTDDSVARICAALPQVILLPAGGNRGFAAGNNVGIRYALEHDADFIWLLNNDTLAPPDTLTKLLAASHDVHTGIVGTVLRYMHDPAKVQAWGGGGVTRWLGYSSHYVSPTALTPNSFLTFASVLLRRDVFQTVGLLDENFFMYFEDADFCFRARDTGWKLTVAADTAVLHKEGGSADVSTPRFDRIATNSGMHFLRCHGRPAWLAPWLFVIARLGKRAVRFQFAAFRATLRGIGDWRRHAPTAFQEEA